MTARIERRAARARDKQPIRFLDPQSRIPRTTITVQDARDGRFIGSDIPPDLRRQWIQGTGPAARPDAPVEKSIRNVAYALLSGADGWMFDGEDALGQVSTMSLDNQRNLKLAIHRDPVFLTCRRAGRRGNEPVGAQFPEADDRRRLAQAARLHDEDLPPARSSPRRSPRSAWPTAPSFSASIVDATLYIVNNHQQLQQAGSSLVLYLPKIQTAEEAALWSDILSGLEAHLGLAAGAIKVYVLVEQLECCFQLMEIRAALGQHFIGFDTGRWDYINSVSDAMAWDPEFINPNIDTITMTYGYMRNYEDRVDARAARLTSSVSSPCGRAGWSPISRSAPKRESRAA